MWWREVKPVMPQTIEECDEKMREQFEGATVLQNGVVLVKDGDIVDEEAWKKRVQTVFDRREKYQNKCRLNYIQEKAEQNAK